MSKQIIVENNSRKIKTLPQVKYCDNFVDHLGFTFRPRITHDEGLILVWKRDTRLDSSITMLFVFFNLAVFWINSDMQVVDKVIAKSWRPSYFPKQPAKYALEIHPERWGDYEIGDLVQFKDV